MRRFPSSSTVVPAYRSEIEDLLSPFSTSAAASSASTIYPAPLVSFPDLQLLLFARGQAARVFEGAIFAIFGVDFLAGDRLFLVLGPWAFLNWLVGSSPV